MRSFTRFLGEELRLSPVPNTQYGSNDGGVHTDDAGGRHYVKFYHNPDQGRVEALSDQIHRHMGVHTLGATAARVNGRPALVTPWNDHLQRMRPSDFNRLTAPQARQLATIHHAAVLTKNHDVVGLEHDNILRHKQTGDLYAGDLGGSFHFRAQGGSKDYGPSPEEHSTFRLPGHRPSSQVFSALFRDHPDSEHHADQAVRGMDASHVHGLFRTSGLANWQELHQNFVHRRDGVLGS